MFSLTRVWSILLRHLYLLSSSPTRFIPYFLWAIIDIVLWGFITRYLAEIGNATFSFIPIFLGAVLLWDFVIRVQQGVTTPFLEDVWSRNFMNIFASPIRISEYLSGFMLTSIIMSALGLTIMLVLASLLFGLSLFTLGIALFPFILTLFLFGIALGIFGAALVLRFGPSAEWLVWPLPTILSPFIGIFYPIDILPGWMQAIGAILPPQYVFTGMRSIILEGDFVGSSLLIAIALCFVFLALACGYFMYVYRYVIRHGLIARFGAEAA